MATIADMKKASKDKQISYRSLPEIVANLDYAAASLARTETFDGAKLRTGHVVNAVALWLGGLKDDELRAFMAPKLRAYSQYLAGSVDGGLQPSGKVHVGRVVGQTAHNLDDNPGLHRDDQPKRPNPKGVSRPKR